jgi:hypothetical protein
MRELKFPDKFRFLFEPHRNKAAWGGRGSAKSTSFARALLILGRQRKLRILCTREVQKSIKESVKQLLDDQIDEMGMKDFYHSILTEIRGANGTVFIFTGLSTMTETQVKSMEGIDICWVEEAQTISESSMEVLIPTIRKENIDMYGWEEALGEVLAGSELWFTWNPKLATDAVDQRFRAGTPPPDSVVVKVNYYDNPYFPGVLDVERKHDLARKPLRYKHIWEGEYEPSSEDALWTREDIERNRVTTYPDLVRIVVALDPATTNTDTSDQHGLVVAGLGTDKHGYLFSDLTKRASIKDVCTSAVEQYHDWKADRLVAEVNNGGDWIEHSIRLVPGASNISYKKLTASKGKQARAEPVASLYERNMVHHVGEFPDLEAELLTWEPKSGDASPNRLDALTWAMTELMLTGRQRKMLHVRI